MNRVATDIARIIYRWNVRTLVENITYGIIDYLIDHLQ